MKLLRIKLDDSLHARLKVQAAKEYSTMQEIARDVLADYVAEREKVAKLEEAQNA